MEYNGRIMAKWLNLLEYNDIMAVGVYMRGGVVLIRATKCHYTQSPTSYVLYLLYYYTHLLETLTGQGFAGNLRV